MAIVGKQIAQRWNFAQARNAVDYFGVRSLNESAQDACFAFLQTDIMFDFLLPDNGLVHPTNAVGAHNLRYIDAQFHTHISVRMPSRRDVGVPARLDIL